MPDRSAVFSGGTAFAYSQISDLLYAISGTQLVARSAGTGAVVGSWDFPSSLAGVGISADGRYVIVGQEAAIGPEGARLGVAHRINLETGVVDDITFPLDTYELGVRHVAVTADGLAIITTRGGSSFNVPRGFQVEEADPAVSPVPDVYVGGNTPLFTSPNQRYVLFQVGSSSNGSLHLLDSASQTVAHTSLYELGYSGYYGGRADVTDEGLVVAYSGSKLIVYGSDLEPIYEFPPLLVINTKFADVQFTSDGQNLLLWNVETDRIDVYRVSDWTKSGEFDPGFSVDVVGNDAVHGQMDLIANGEVLLLQGYDGQNRLIDLTYLPTLDLTGTASNNSIFGLAGADRIIGLAGDDALFGQDGNDVLVGGAGQDVLNGGAGRDTADYSNAASGVTLNLSIGVASNDGDGGTDSFVSIENLTGSAFADNLTGDANANVLSGGAGGDTLNSEGGDDVLSGGGGVDVLNGGAGFDTADYSQAAAGVTARLDIMRATNDGDGGTDTFTSIEAITGSAFNDLLVGGGLGDTLRGGLGADTLLGQGGNDVLWGGAGAANQLQGGLGDDYYVLEANDSVIELAGQGTDTVEARIAVHTLANHVENLIFGGVGNFTGTGNSGNNTITGGAGDDVLRGRGGTDVLIGGLGMDTADYSFAAAGVHARLDNMRAVNDGDGATDTFVGIEAIVGSAFNDLLVGGALGDRLYGGLGADTLLGGAGDDILSGGQGAANQLQGGTGDDLYILDAYDTVVELAGQGHDTIEARVGAVNMAANVEDMYYVGFNKFYGTGNALDNVITGGIGDDILKGMGGNDTLRGGAGLDEAQFRGSIAQYTVTAEGAGYRIVDSVAGRDGSTYVESIELIRFLDGNTATELTYPGGAPAAPAAPDPGGKARLDAEVLPALFDDKIDDALVLPGLAFDKADEAFVLPALPDDQPLVLPGLEAVKAGDQPLVLPGLEQEVPLFLALEARLALSGDWMLAMDGELAPRHDDWMG